MSVLELILKIASDIDGNPIYNILTLYEEKINILNSLTNSNSLKKNTKNHSNILFHHFRVVLVYGFILNALINLVNLYFII